jgi:flagellar protein FliS
MYSTAQRGIGAYTRIGIETGVPSASPQQLILMLYEGAILAIAAGQQHLREHNIAAKGSAISKAISIIEGGLKASLDLNVGGELAKNLSELYAYMGRRLLQANLKNDSAGLEEVRQLLLQLKGAWEALAAGPAAAAAGHGAAPPRNPANTYGNS